MAAVGGSTAGLKLLDVLAALQQLAQLAKRRRIWGKIKADVFFQSTCTKLIGLPDILTFTVRETHGRPGFSDGDSGEMLTLMGKGATSLRQRPSLGNAASAESHVTTVLMTVKDGGRT